LNIDINNNIVYYQVILDLYSISNNTEQLPGIRNIGSLFFVL